MRQRFWMFWDRLGGIVMLGAVAAVFLLGLFGVARYSDIHDLGIPFGTQLYITASLFLLENGSLDGQIPWALEIARWAAPVVLATAAIGTVVSVARHRVWALGVRSLRGHVVIVGLGERGWRAARSAKQAGRAVAVIETDAAGPHVRAARRLGIPVIVGSATEVSRLRAARLDRASRAIVLVGDAAETTAIADAVADLFRSPRLSFRPEFCCFLAVPDADTANDLNALMHDPGAPFQREFFNLEDRSGPVIIDRWAGLLTTAGPPPPIIVIGADAVARSVIAAAARQWSARADDDVLEVHWLLSARSRGVERLLTDLGGTHGSARIIVQELRSPDSRGEIAATLHGLHTPPALVVVSERDDAEALSVLSCADVALRGTDTVVVGVTEGPSLVRLLHGHDRIELFDVAAELGDDEQIAHGRLETLGRALHDGYLRQLNRSLPAEERAAKPAYRPWAELPDELRSQNYDAARAARGMLRELGFDIVPRTPLLPAITVLDDDVVEALAEAEHHRWFRSRHPGAAAPDWADVDPMHAEQSRDQARRLPGILTAADLQITPAAEERA
ncbi:NAD-binding protein [Microbacterium soli]|uniref:RCK N-terminal domain-containing protein n=1 Tax=Microbacterium soli TaxID=446075 RepID=A0ABP7NFI9_9MICO